MAAPKCSSPAWQIPSPGRGHFLLDLLADLRPDTFFAGALFFAAFFAALLAGALRAAFLAGLLAAFLAGLFVVTTGATAGAFRSGTMGVMTGPGGGGGVQGEGGVIGEGGAAGG